MHTNLMCAAGFEAAFDKRGAIKNIKPLPARDCPLPALVFDERDLLAVRCRPGERGVTYAFARLGNAVDDREIPPPDRMGGELLGQPFVGDISLGDYQQPGRILVDTMDDAGACHPPD